MTINPYIFREYDIRGKVAEDFPAAIVELLGKGFGTFVARRGGREITLSGDVRLTTPQLIDSFKKGVLSTGIDVILIGILPTPVNYFSMYHLDVDGAVQITGSHNPPEYNGFKLSFEKQAVFGRQIQEIRTCIEHGDFAQGEGSEVRHAIKTAYMDMLCDKISLAGPVRIAMDCGNAAAGLVAPQIFRRLGVELTEIYCDIDGSFPNHHPDPTVPENLAELIRRVKSGSYDAGIAFDGDADRIGVVDERGEIIWADTLMALFLPEIVEPGDEIIFDVKCSQALEDMILKYGGRPVMWKTGHSLIKQKMRELNCKFGGEMSGHIFFADDYFGYDDAVYVAARLAQTLSRSRQKLSELTAEIPTYFSTPEMRLSCESDEEKFRIAGEAAEYFRANYDCIEVDGVRIKFENGWGLVRSSNTQPVIVCRFEASSEAGMQAIKKLVLDKLNSIGTLTPDVGH